MRRRADGSLRYSRARMSWRRILLLSIALVAVLATTTWTMLQNSSAATDFVRRALQAAFVPRLELADTRLELAAGRLALHELRLADPTYGGRDLLRIERGHVDVQAAPLDSGIALRHVLVDGFTIELGPTWPDTTGLLRTTGGDNGPPDAALPVVELRHGTARVHLREGQPPLEVTAIELTAAPRRGTRNRVRLHGTATLTEPRAELALTGEADLATGAARLTLNTTDVDLSQESIARLCRLLGIERQGLDLGGELAALSVELQLPATNATGRAPRLTAALSLRAVHVDAKGLPRVMRNADVEIRAETDDGGAVRATVVQHDELGDLSITAEARRLAGEQPQLTVRATGRDVGIDEDVLAALRSFPIGRRIVDALRPQGGRADIDLYLENPHAPGGATELDLSLRDVAMSFVGFDDDGDGIGFPLPLHRASGRVVLREDTLLLRDMRAAIVPSAGGGDVTLTGHLDVRPGRGDQLRLDVRGSNIAFSDDLRKALSALLQDQGALYDKLAPAGRADVNVAVRPPAELPGRFTVEVMPKGAAMRWAGFPYHLDDLHGTIHVQKEEARFDLAGRHGNGGLTMRGHIPLVDAHAPEHGFEAVVDCEQLRLDDDLQQAVAVVVPELDRHWRSARPEGRLSGRIKVWRPQADSELFHDVRLTLDAVDLELPVAPWRATSLGGQLLVQGSGPDARIDFDALRGELHCEDGGTAQLALLGHLESGSRPARDLAVVVRDLELSEQLGQSLDELGALAFSTWQSLRPSGRVDLVCRSRSGLGGDASDDLQVVVQLVDVRSEAPMLPRPAEQMTGELHVEGGELTFRDVRGVLGDATVHCTNGRVRQLPGADGRTEIAFDVHAKDFPVDDGLGNLFSGPLREAVRDRNLRGQADVDGLSLRFRIPTSDDCREPFTTTIHGAIGLDGVDMQLGAGSDGIRVFDLRGMVTLAESTVTETGGQLVGTLGRGSLSVFGHPFEAIDAVFTADAHKLSLGSLRTRVHDGELRNAEPNTNALTYLLPSPEVPEGRLVADVGFDGVDIFSLLTVGGWQNPPYTGSASGRMTLHRLDGNQVVGAEAEGRLHIERADLGKVPLFTAIYAQLPAADQPRFNGLDLSYRLDGDAFVFEQLEIRSDLLAARGKGRMALDGYLDVEMELDNLLGQSADPLVMPLIDYLAKNLVSFRLFGHLRDLRARTDFVSAGAPPRQPVPPMPPARPRPTVPGF